MPRINIYSRPDADEPYNGEAYEKPTMIGWFDPDKATEQIDEDTYWDGNNNRGVLSGLQCGYEELFRTANGRWVRHYNARNEFNGPEFYEFLTDEQAQEWLLRNNSDETVEKYFGEIEEERGPGAPVTVGGQPVNIKLGSLQAAVDTWRSGTGMSRAEAVRRLVAKALGLAEEPTVDALAG